MPGNNSRKERGKEVSKVMMLPAPLPPLVVSALFKSQ